VLIFVPGEHRAMEGHGSTPGRGCIFGRGHRLRRKLLRLSQEHPHLQVQTTFIYGTTLEQGWELW